MQGIRETLIHSYARVHVRRAYDENPATALPAARSYLDRVYSAQAAFDALTAGIATAIVWYAKPESLNDASEIISRELSAALAIVAALENGATWILTVGRELPPASVADTDTHTSTSTDANAGTGAPVTLMRRASNG